MTQHRSFPWTNNHLNGREDGARDSTEKFTVPKAGKNCLGLISLLLANQLVRSRCAFKTVVFFFFFLPFIAPLDALPKKIQAIMYNIWFLIPALRALTNLQISFIILFLCS